MKYLLYILCLFILSCENNSSSTTQNIYGCTDPTACNFNADANIFDNTCLYGLEQGAIDYEIFTQYLYDCDGSCLQYLGCDESCYFEEGLDDLDSDDICDNIDECVGYYSCSEGCIEPNYDGNSPVVPDTENYQMTGSHCNDFTSILLTDEDGNWIGYEGILDNASMCPDNNYNGGWLPSSFNLQNYPNQFNPTTNIDLTIPISGYIKIVIIDQNFNEIDIIHDDWLDLGVYSFTWDSPSFSDGYYRIIINRDNQEVCYRNIRMLGD